MVKNTDNNKAEEFSNTMVNYAKNYSKTHSEEEYQERMNQLSLEFSALMMGADF